MINIRGNQYSRRHLTLSPSDADFWNFSHHESALFDYSATIDHVLRVTGQDDLFFAGYSMGTTQYLILLAERPEYNRAIRAGFLMGPAAVGKHATNPAVVASPYAELIERAANLLGKNCTSDSTNKSWIFWVVSVQWTLFSVYCPSHVES